jgi:hypothetical protein
MVEITGSTQIYFFVLDGFGDYQMGTKVEIPSFPLYECIGLTFLMASTKIGDDHLTISANGFLELVQHS